MNIASFKSNFLLVSVFSLFCFADSIYADQKTNKVAQTKKYEQLLSRFVAPNKQELSYDDFLKHYKVPGLSFAVVDNYQVVYSHTAGLKETGTQNKIDSNTAFSTASISKPVTATIVAMLAEQGKLELDAPVSQYLRRWSIPTSQFTQNKPITFRHLLTHTAGTSQGGFADFNLGDDIPTPIESLNGIKLPRYNSPISVNFTPESDWEYSGGGYVIAQIAIEDITGKSLQQLAEDMIFTPLNMQHTTMFQNGHPKFLSNVAKAHDGHQKVMKDGIIICPQIAPSGMWSTAIDMAKFTIEYQKALAGKPTKVISKWVAEATTKVHSLKKVGGWSAGWMRMEAKGNLDWFSHGGSNTGTGGHVMSTMQGGKGIIVFINALTPQRNPAIDALIDSIISLMNWRQTVDSSQSIPDKNLITKMLGRYLSPFDQIITIKKQGDNLIYNNPLQIGGGNFQGKMFYQGQGKFALENNSNLFGIENSPKDKQAYLTVYRAGTSLKDFAMRKLAYNEVLPFEIAETQSKLKTIEAYKAWQKQRPQSKMLATNTLNRAGYMALAQKKFNTAINYFSVYTALYPEDANAFDSLAEAYMTKGDTELAITYYKKSLSLDSQNQNAIDMLRKLHASKGD